MNPTLKKALRDRGIKNKNPASWQENGWTGDKCPECNASLFSQTGPITEPTRYRCYSCGKLFEKEGWRGFKEVLVG